MGQNPRDTEGHWSNYAEYSKTLRAWLVAYGVGAPALFLLNKDVPAKVGASPHLATIVTLFVVGLSIQIALAFVNKWAAWHMYMGAQNASFKRTFQYRVWSVINAQSWFDFFVDLAALVMFARATWLVLNIFLGVAPG